jgi:hypothetical protein
MKMKILIAAIVLALFSVNVSAQSRFLVGGEGGKMYDNTTIALLGVGEFPIGHRFEVGIRDSFSPYSGHTALGNGHANSARGSAILWMSKSFGLAGNIENNGYTAGSVTKNSFYTLDGVIIRRMAQGSPVRFEFDYVRQVDNQVADIQYVNGVRANGTEPDYLQGGRFDFDARLGCSGKVCYRLEFETQVGHVLTQGDPNCDGTWGPDTCGHRASAISGGALISFKLEFPRRKATENDPF